jgi:protocatechuate 3,4-dioxygenase beta subunit
MVDWTRLDPLFEQRLARRNFLGAGLGAGVSAALAATGLARLARAAGCDLTTPDILGPYFVAGAPVRTVIASADEPGPRLFIQGRVFANDCTSPLPGTILDVWQASQAGCYSVLEVCPDEDPMNLRGQFLAGAGGTYAFESVMPGYYPGRCLHIHYRIAPVNGPVLVTQLYFAGDPRIPSDPFASRPEAAARIIPLIEDAAGFHGTFDISLAALAAAVDDPAEAMPTALVFHQAYPNPFRSETTLRFSLPQESPVEMSVYDAEGRQVQTLVRGTLPAGYHTAHWDGRDARGRAVGRGIYFSRLKTSAGERVQKLIAR